MGSRAGLNANFYVSTFLKDTRSILIKNVPVRICLYIIYSRRKGRNVEIMNTSRMVIAFLISSFVLPFLHSLKWQIIKSLAILTIFG